MTGWQIFLLTLVAADFFGLFFRLMFRVYRLEQILREARDRLNDPLYE